MKQANGQKVLAALEGILEMQRTIRRGLDPCVQTGLVFLRFYYEELPEFVACRLTEIHLEDLERISQATSTEGTQGARQEIAASIAGDAAFAQVIRAANSYRGKLGLGPLAADGRSEQTEGGSSSE